MIWVSGGILLAQIIVAIVSYLTIYRHRSIYGIKGKAFRLPVGTNADYGALNSKEIDKVLANGEYTILQFVKGKSVEDVYAIMGRIKKEKKGASSEVNHD